MNPRYLARLALARLPRPYTDQVILHVFCEIERTPHLREAYDGLMRRWWFDEGPYTQQGLNSQISQSVRSTLQATTGERIDVIDICEIVEGVSLLDDIKSDWSWDD